MEFIHSGKYQDDDKDYASPTDLIWCNWHSGEQSAVLSYNAQSIGKEIWYNETLV